ncbi:GntR family transcriptional regulator [Georgenia sp. H159]|uniref:GntR family transcriptional regulator n=1 Tax=Georgenia sp. H159 TaxID=3076115 RepID=UPI002D791E6E|nr:GntR family transcriptional regulator [Georgenia sp. H159]
MQISDQFRTLIATGQWPPSYRLPSEPDLAQELSVSRGTLRKALQTLTSEGLLRQVRGRGTFVTAATIEPSIAQKLSTLSEDYASQGIIATTEVLRTGMIVPPQPVAALLHIPEGGKVFRLFRRHMTDDGPVALLHNYVDATGVSGIEDIDFTKEQLFATLEGVYGLPISAGRRAFSAQRATADVASQLELPEGDPVQYLEQITYLSGGKPIEYSDVWIRSDRLRVTSLLAR